jgi:hypothetical protein
MNKCRQARSQVKTLVVVVGKLRGHMPVFLGLGFTPWAQESYHDSGFLFLGLRVFILE